MPKFIEPIEKWVAEMTESPGLPTPTEVREHLAIPLLNQIKIDTGDTIYDLSAGRLGVHGAPQSVRQQSRQMEVTRARVYQLLEDCAKVMHVRWPEGQAQLAALTAKHQAEATDSDDLRLYLATVELFYPGKNRIDEDDTEE